MENDNMLVYTGKDEDYREHVSSIAAAVEMKRLSKQGWKAN